MAMPPSMAKEPGASVGTPLVARLVDELVVEVAVSTTLLVTVVSGTDVVDDVARVVVEETRVLEGTETLVLVTVELWSWVLVLVEDLLVLSASEVVLVAALLLVLLGTELLLLLLSSSSSSLPPTILNGKPYWKTAGSDSRVIMMP